MHKSRRGAAFYVETILLVLFLLFSLTVLVRMLGAAKQLSGEARQLSCAVRIAQDAAEQVAVCDSTEDLAALLDAQWTGDGMLITAYDTQGAAAAEDEAAYFLFCRVEQAAQPRGTLLTARITVRSENGVLLYELETQKYLRG